MGISSYGGQVLPLGSQTWHSILPLLLGDFGQVTYLPEGLSVTSGIDPTLPGLLERI